MQLTDAASVSVPLPVMYSNITWNCAEAEALHLFSLPQPAEQGIQAVLLSSGPAPSTNILQKKESFNLPTESPLTTSPCT